MQEITRHAGTLRHNTQHTCEYCKYMQLTYNTEQQIHPKANKRFSISRESTDHSALESTVGNTNYKFQQLTFQSFTTVTDFDNTNMGKFQFKLLYF